MVLFGNGTRLYPFFVHRGKENICLLNYAGNLVLELSKLSYKAGIDNAIKHNSARSLFRTREKSLYSFGTFVSCNVSQWYQLLSGPKDLAMIGHRSILATITGYSFSQFNVGSSASNN